MFSFLLKGAREFAFVYLRHLQGPGTPCFKMGLFCQDGPRPQIPAEFALTGVQFQLEVGWRSGGEH